MSKKVLVVVDMQNDFVTGSLANQSALEVIPNIKREIESGKYDHIIFTRDTHQENYLETQEGKNLPVKHCIQNTWGWEIVSELQFNGENIHFVDKPTFGYKNWHEFITHTVGIDGDDCEFTFVGTVTSICVVSNALIIKSEFPEAIVKCISDCCAPLFGSEENQKATFEVMKSCQIEIS